MVPPFQVAEVACSTEFDRVATGLLQNKGARAENIRPWRLWQFGHNCLLKLGEQVACIEGER